MLVLTRKQNEEIQIGDNIRLTVLRVKGNSVRIGIQAPSDVRVVRGELPAKPRIKDVTVMVTDPTTGVIREAWSDRIDSSVSDGDGQSHVAEGDCDNGLNWAASKRGCSDSQTRSQANPATQQSRSSIPMQPNRLQELVGRVQRHQSPLRRQRAR